MKVYTVNPAIHGVIIVKKIHIFVLIIIASICAYTQGFSQTLESPLSYDGGADAHYMKNDTVCLENTVLDDGWKNENIQTISVGFSMLYSPYTSLFYIPFEYSPVHWFTVDITLPFLYKLLINSSSEREKLGFGDIKVGMSFSFTPLDLFVTTTSIKFTFPTGDAAARDRDLMVPMGYGSFTLSALQSFSTMHFGVKKFGIRFFVNLGAVCYMKTQLEPDNTVRYYIDYSYSISTLGGFEMRIIEKFYILGKLSYLYLPERRYKEEIYATYTISRWYDLNDSMHALNIIPAIRYDFLPDFTGTLMTVIPLFEEQDDDVYNHHKRSWGIFIGLEKRFGLLKPSRKMRIRKKRKR